MAAAYLVLQLFAASRSTLWDRDEPRFCRATCEMVRSGNYLYPTFNGELRPDKPILIYWLMSAPVRLFGPTGPACRFWSPVGAAAALLLTYALGRRFLDRRAALWAMLMLALCLHMLILSAAAVTDAPLLAVVLLSLLPIAASLVRGPSAMQTALLGAAFALALLLKGPVGPAIALLTLIGALWLLRRERPRYGRYAVTIPIALGFAVACFVAWGLPANAATDGLFLRRGIGRHVVGRSLGAMETHGGNFFLYLPYYFPVVLGFFFPWSLYLPAVVSAVAGRRLGTDRFRALVVGWAVPTFALMSVVQTKLPHYVLPIFPALALAVAALLSAEERGDLNERDLEWLRRGGWILAVLGGAGVLAFLVVPWLPPTKSLAPSCLVEAALLAATVVLFLKAHLRGAWRRGAKVLAVGMVAMHLNALLFVLPAMETYKISPRLAAAIRERVPDDVPVFTRGFREPTLVFYLRRPPEDTIEGLDSPEGVAAWASESSPGVLVIPRRRLTRIEEAHGPLGLVEFASVEGYNYSNGKWLDVLALGRALPPRTDPAAEEDRPL